MSNKRYDAIVIGAGIGGLGAAAMLTKEFGQKVLVLERAPFIGGRAASFVGRGNKVTIDGLELDANGLRKALGLAQTYLHSSRPDIETIINEGLLDGYTFEAGGHGLFWGNKGRIRFLLDHLQKPVDLPCNVGLGYVDYEGGNKAYQVKPTERYQWMSEEGFKKTMEALRGMGTATIADCAKVMGISLQDWLDSFNLHPEAYDYIKVLASSQTAQAEPKMTPAGDFLGYMAIARDIKMNLITGSCATIHEPGTIAIPKGMEEVVLAGGGEVRRSSTVKQVIIEGGAARGVVVETPGGAETIYADAVILNVMPKEVFKVLDKQHFPADWAETVEYKFWGAGLLSAYIGLKRDIWAEKGLDERSFIYMPGVIRGEGFIGDVDIVMWNMGACARRTPEGKRSFEFSVALTDKEMRDPARVGRVIDFCNNWFKETFPTWEEDTEFCIWTPSPDAYGHWRPVGFERPDVRSPWVEGLYFSGDQYGKRLWGGGVDGAALSAVMCVDAMMGTDFETKIFPAYHRGIPADA